MLRFTENENKERIYTLKEDGSIPAHPAKFSPHDKYSEYRVDYKIKNNIPPFN